MLQYTQGGDAMEFVLEFLLEVFFEIFGEGFIALSSAFVPQKVVSKKGKKIIGYVFLSISLALIACLFECLLERSFPSQSPHGKFLSKTRKSQTS